jgi:hypothetical protein
MAHYRARLQTYELLNAPKPGKGGAMMVIQRPSPRSIGSRSRRGRSGLGGATPTAASGLRDGVAMSSSLDARACFRKEAKTDIGRWPIGKWCSPLHCLVKLESRDSSSVQDGSYTVWLQGSRVKIMTKSSIMAAFANQPFLLCRRMHVDAEQH